MLKIMTVFGTRPEAIKMAPLVKELLGREKIKTIVCLTGQHEEMLDQVMNLFNIRADYNLKIMKPNQTLNDITIDILNKMGGILINEQPDIVLVHGDTSTTFATSLACFYHNIPVGHIEAGLRTYNIHAPYPEEFNRQAVSIISKINFAPTILAKENLLNEGKDKNSIYVTGNTVIDALKTTIQSNYKHELLDWASDSRLILLTAHRRENIGENMEEIFSAINRVVLENKDLKVLYPIHKNPQVRTIANKIFSENNRIRIIEPLDVIDFHNIMAKAFLILTDSGGIQEEAPSLGIPVLVMRDTTERPEGVNANTLKLIGTKSKSVYENFNLLVNNKIAYNNMSNATNPYGDGNSSKKIVDIIETEFGVGELL